MASGFPLIPAPGVGSALWTAVLFTHFTHVLTVPAGARPAEPHATAASAAICTVPPHTAQAQQVAAFLSFCPPPPSPIWPLPAGTNPMPVTGQTQRRDTQSPHPASCSWMGTHLYYELWKPPSLLGTQCFRLMTLGCTLRFKDECWVVRVEKGTLDGRSS